MAARTGIPVENLAALEFGDAEVLPDLPVVERAVAGYAAALGLDSNDLARRYLREIQEGRGGAIHDPPPVSVSARSNESARPNRSMVATVVAIVIGLLAGLAVSAVLFRQPAAGQVQGAGQVEGAGPEPSRASAPPEPASPSSASAGPGPRAAAPVAAAPEEAADAAPRATATAGARAAAGGDDLSGSWTLTNTIESTSYRAFRGLRIEYELDLRQEGERLQGTGVKRAENGKRLPRSRRTPIEVEGTRVGDRLELRFTEAGARRASSGRFDLQVADERTLRGTFTSDAAESRGTSVASREGAGPR